MLPVDIRKLILAFTPSVTNKTLCLAAIKCGERTKWSYRVVGDCVTSCFYDRCGMLCTYAPFENSCVIMEVRWRADMLKKYSLLGCDLPNCAETLYRKVELIMNFRIEYREVVSQWYNFYAWYGM